MHLHLSQGQGNGCKTDGRHRSTELALRTAKLGILIVMQRTTHIMEWWTVRRVMVYSKEP